MTHSETIQKIALEGPLSVPMLVILGLVVAVLCAVYTWRDCRAAGALKMFFLLTLARLTVISIVLWMLAGATSVTLRHDTRPKSLVVLVDASGSMGMIDPVDGSGNAAQWAEADGRTAAPGLGELDRGIGELRSALAGAKQIREEQSSASSMAEAQKAWDRIHRDVSAGE